MICNSLRGAIVTGFLVLNDRENKRRDGDGKKSGTARGRSDEKLKAEGRAGKVRHVGGPLSTVVRTGSTVSAAMFQYIH